MNAVVKDILRKVESWPEEDQEELAEVAREIEVRRTACISSPMMSAVRSRSPVAADSPRTRKRPPSGSATACDEVRYCERTLADLDEFSVI
jgi:hypothetical protein